MSAAENIPSEPLVTENDVIKSLHLFAEADDEALQFAKEKLELVEFAKDQPVILQGESGDHVYFIKSGSVEIVNYRPEGNRIHRLALLKAGSHFAEVSVLNKATKSSSAYAYEDSELYRMTGTNFSHMLQRFPAICKKLTQMLAELNHRVEASTEFIPFFTPMMYRGGASQLSELIPSAKWASLGVIPVEFKGGILSLAMKDPRSNAAIDMLNGRVSTIAAYAIDNEGFDAVLKMAMNPAAGPRKPMMAETKHEHPPTDVLELFQEHELFSRFPAETLQQLKDNLPAQEIKKGMLLAKPGDTPKTAYLIWKGSLHLSRPIDRSKAFAPIMKLGSGDLVCEVALMTSKPVIHFIRATEDTTVIPLPFELVTQLMSSAAFAYPLAQHLGRRLSALGKLSGIQYFNYPGVLNFQPLKRLLPYNVMTDYQAIPLSLIDNEVQLGVVSTDRNTASSLINRYLSEYRVKVVNINEQQFKSWLSQFASMKDTGPAEPQAKGGATVDQKMDPVALLNDIFMRGLTNRASDIHFEPFEFDMTVRYRVDGVLSESSFRIGKELAKQVISRLKVLSDMDLANHSIPQDGQLKCDIKGEPFLARASVLPVKYGEKVVLRIIRSKNSLIPLNMLAPDRRSIQMLQHVSRAPYGLFIVTGPTGSGKTTTLYSLLGDMNKVDVNITTVEDPIEMEIAGTNQVEIDKKRGVDFQACLKSVLRQDPDVVMIGEIRDPESARIVFDAAITGHVVLSTLHTNNSMDVVHRLRDLGVTPATIGAGLLGVMTQRLVRGVCRHCTTTRPTTTAEARVIRSTFPDLEVPEEMAHGAGCPACGHTGYMDRIPVFEMWRNTAEMTNALSRGAELAELQAIARKDGFETLFEFGVKMALIGLTTIDEVRRNISHD